MTLSNGVSQNILLFFICSYFAVSSAVHAQSINQQTQNANCIPEINFPGGRIAMSFDGNQHDPDDVGALPMSLAFTWAAGLQSNVTFVEHSNHICNVNNVLHGKMQESAAGLIERFGYDSNRIHDFYSDPKASTDKFVIEINKSTANNPLWIVAAGPMESIWRALNSANKNVLSNVSIVSHSAWNEKHGDCGDDSHTWEDLRAFEKNNGLTLIEITDQNSSNGDDDFSTPRSKWYWLRDSKNPNLAWVYSRDQFSTGNFVKFDPSDSGMVYWLISGGPNGGNERAGAKEARQLFENPCIIEEEEETKPIIALKVPSGDQVVSLGYDLKVEVTISDADGIEKAEIFINNKNIRAERAAPYEWGHDGSSNPEELNGLPIGEHEIKIVATDNLGATSETSFMLNVVESLSTDSFDRSDKSFLVYPNPSASGVFQLSESVEWELYTVNGVQIQKESSSVVNIVEWPAGLYFLKARVGLTQQTMKLMVL